MKNIDKIADIIRKGFPGSIIAIDGSNIDVNFHSGARIKFDTNVKSKWIRVSFAHHWVKIPTSPTSQHYEHCVSTLHQQIRDYKFKKEAKKTGELAVNSLKGAVPENVHVSTSGGRVIFSVPANKANKAAKLLSTL